MKKRITNVEGYLADDVANESDMLMEAQFGALRDVYRGAHPFTSSPCCLSEFAPIGSDAFRPNDRVIGAWKAFPTCFGTGPFVTEMDAEEAALLRELAYEYIPPSNGPCPHQA